MPQTRPVWTDEQITEWVTRALRLYGELTVPAGCEGAVFTIVAGMCAQQELIEPAVARFAPLGPAN